MNNIKIEKEYIAIYHVVRKSEKFDKVANDLLDLIKEASVKFPNKKRMLYLDIEGHRNKEGGFDLDMLDIQTKFLTEMLMPYLTKATVPLGTVESTKGQLEDIPDSLVIK